MQPSHSRRFTRGFLITLVAGVLGLTRAVAKDAPPTHITVQLDWVAEPEHGGFYQALAQNYFKDAGLDVEIIPGGPNAYGIQKTARGSVNFAQADSTTTLTAISHEVPLLNVAAVFQNDPSVLMLHADNPVKKFEDLNGKSIMARPEWVFLPYLKKKYGIDFTIVPQNFSVANFVADKDFIQQGFYIAEPYHIIKQGAPAPKYLYAWDAGFDAYTVVVTNKTWAKKNPEIVKTFLKAYIHGWQDYLDNDPTPANTLMKKANSKNTDDFLAFSRKMIIDEKLVIGRINGSDAQIGRISPDRFQTQIKQLEDLNVIPKGKLQVDQVMTTEFLP